MATKVIVTGGSRGIGKAIVEKLAAEECEVVFNYLSNAQAAEDIVHTIKNAGGKAAAYPADLSDFDQAASFVAKALEFMGDADGLVNNAGITRDKNLFLMAREDWDKVIQTNLTGYFNVTRNIITHFLKHKKGSIVNITSVSGFMGVGGQTNYCASKAGIIGFTKALSKECARAQVPVNCVAPGYIETDMTNALNEEHLKEIKKTVPMKRLGTAQEVAELVSFLLSHRARYITGQVLTIDGGLTA